MMVELNSDEFVAIQTLLVRNLFQPDKALQSAYEKIKLANETAWTMNHEIKQNIDPEVIKQWIASTWYHLKYLHTILGYFEEDHCFNLINTNNFPEFKLDFKEKGIIQIRW